MSVVIPDPAVTDWVPMGFGLGGPIPNQPSCRVGNSASMAINNTATLTIPFNVERWDTDNIWDSGAPTRLTCRTAGKYQIGGTIHFQPLTNQAWGGSWDLQLRLNGSTVMNYGRSGGYSGGNGTTVSVDSVWDLKVGDYVEIVAANNSGVNGNVYQGSGWSPELWMNLIGGVPGPPGVGVPTPIVNNQFVKGVGGVAQWAPPFAMFQGSLTAPWSGSNQSTITLPWKADVAVTMSATIYSNAVGMSGWAMWWDGATQPNWAKMFFNEANSHKSLTASNIILGQAAGAHTLQPVYGYGSATSDANDFCSWVAIALPVP